MNQVAPPHRLGLWTLLAALIATVLIYAPGLRGGYLFDDYPNIVDNHGVQPADARLPSLVRAALSSPSSEFKRPLASLSFAANYLVSDLDPFGMKLTNLGIHLLNGLLVFLVVRQAIQVWRRTAAEQGTSDVTDNDYLLAALICAAWLMLPINLTAVLYVVQRMESLANLFVLLGLWGYIKGRQRMLLSNGDYAAGLALCIASVTACTALGLLAKETAVMLPLYAGLTEWILFGYRQRDGRKDKLIITFYLAVLALPLCAGLAWLLPSLLQPGAWSTRDFTLKTRLLSEARIVCDYIAWSIVPSPRSLSFYHDDFAISQGLLSPWTTLASIIGLFALVITTIVIRHRLPMLALGLAWFLGAHLLTATILPLELVYEHRNYFASLGLLIALALILQAINQRILPSFPRHLLFGFLLLMWASSTLLTALAWGSPLRLAEELAARAPNSPRAQYELGRTYIIYSHYDPASPFTQMAYAPLERSAALPKSSILAEQALIFMNSRMRLPLKDAWWESLIGKLKSHRPGVQDESSLGALTQCQREGQCELPHDRMTDAFLAALSHPHPSARLLGMYADYAWNVLNDRSLGLRMTSEAIMTAPREPAYRVTEIQMLLALGRMDEAQQQYRALEQLNIGGSLDTTLQKIRASMADSTTTSAKSGAGGT